MSQDVLPVCRVGEITESETEHGWLVDQLWTRSGVGFLAGAAKLGKTWLGLDLALSVATATPALDRFTVAAPGEVLVYLAEDPPAMVRARLAGLCRHRGLNLDDARVHVITAPSLRLDLDSDRVRLSETIARITPRLLLLDPLVRLHRRNENDSGEIAELLGWLRELQRTYDLAIAVVHHMRKSGGARAGQALRGSGDLHAWTDSGLYLSAGRDRILLTAEHRSAPAPEPIELRLCSRPDGSATHLEVVAPAQPGHSRDTPVAALEERLRALLASADRPLTRVEIRGRLRVNNERLGETLAELDHSGVLVREQHGWSLRSGTEHNPTAL